MSPIAATNSTYLGEWPDLWRGMSLTAAGFDDLGLDRESSVLDREPPLAPVTPLHRDRIATVWGEPDPRDRAPEFSWSDDRTGDHTSDVDDVDDADRWDDGHDRWDDDEWDDDGDWDDAGDEWSDEDDDSGGDDDEVDEWEDDVVWLGEDDDGESVVAGRGGALVAALSTRTGIISGVGALLVTSLLVLGPVSPWNGGADAVGDDPAPSSVRSGPERRGGRVDPTVSVAEPTSVADESGDPATTTATTATDESTPTTAPGADAPSSASDGSNAATSASGGPIDGRPAPVQAVFAPGLITLSGALPSEEAADHLEALARANSTSPGALVSRFLTIDPSLPTDIDVRVIELDSVRFGAGSDVVSADHAAQLDRVAVVLDALPQVDVLVIGHSDQRGDEAANYRLSVERAQSVVDHLVSRGVEPSRLSARAVGEADLLSLDDDEAALALNRRTEFVFSGIFSETGSGGR